MKSHEKIITVSDEHLDQLNHVNNAQYVKWVEMMAEEHWEKLRHDTVFPDDYWVMLEHHIYYKKQVFKGEDITARTWPLEPEGIRQPRMVEFYRDRELVVQSKTLWILMDHSSNRPKRLNREELTYLDD